MGEIILFGSIIHFPFNMDLFVAFFVLLCLENQSTNMTVFIKLLSRLLASKHPEDLQAANRLIKNMVHQVNHG